MSRAHTEEYDVVIVGGGFIGATLAKKLGDEGHRVLILEGGVADGMIPGGYRGFLETFYLNPIKGPPNSPYPQNKFSPMPGKLAGFYPRNGTPIWFGSGYARALGGTSLHWLGVSLRHLPHDFEIKSRYGGGLDWPVSYDELEPWYSDAEHFLGVAGDVEDQAYLGVWFKKGYQYPMKTIPLTWLNSQMKEALDGMTVWYGDEEFSIEVIPLPQARNSDPYDSNKQLIGNAAPYRYGEGARCEGNAACIPICPVQAKYTALRTLYQTNVDNVVIQTQSVASEILVDGNGRVEGIRFKHYKDVDGPVDGHNLTEHTAKAKIYVVGAHAVETPKLCMASKNGGRTPDGIANSSGLLGRHLMDHPYQNFIGLFHHPVGPFRGPDVTGGMPKIRDGEFRKYRAAFRTDLGNWGWFFPNNAPYASVDELVDDRNLFGEGLRREFTSTVPRQFRVGYLIEQLPDPSNRVRIDEKYKDAIGNYIPILDYDYDEYTLRGAQAATEFTDLFFARLGIENYTSQAALAEHATKEYEGKEYNFWGSGHLIGTHMMGFDASSSVVDNHQRTWDHDNLYLVGCGSQPTSATANPTLTMTALALRTAAKISEELR